MHGSGQQPATADAVQPRIEAAMRLLDARRSADAQQLYDEALAIAPNHPLALVGLGHVAILASQPDRGFDLFAHAALIHPDHPVVLAALAHGHGLFGRDEEAIVCLERAIERDPDETAHRRNLGKTLMKLGRMQEAVAELETAVAARPEHGLSRLNLGIALVAVDAAAAERQLRQAVALDPSLAEAKHGLALLAERSGALDEAVSFAEAAYLDDPGSPLFMTTYGRLLLQAGRLVLARSIARRCLALSPHDLDALELSTRLSLVEGEGDAAFRLLGSQVRSTPADAEAILALARSFAFAGNATDALHLADEALRLAPGHPNATFIRRRLLFARGRPETIWDAPADTGSPVAESSDDTRAPAPEEPAAYVVEATADPGETLLLARFLRAGAGRPAPTPVLCGRKVGVLLSHVAGLDVYEMPDEGDPHGPGLPEGAAPLWSLPHRRRLAGADLPGIDLPGANPADPAAYIAAHPANAAAWADALADFPGPRIGILWSRRPELPGLADIVAALPQGATLVSLAEADLRTDLRGHPTVVDAGAHFRTHADLVALVANLDAVVACDGVAAHVAGALGRPGVVVVPADLPWCWGRGGEGGNSLWYPSLAVLPVPPALSARPAVAATLGTLITDALRRADDAQPPEQTAAAEPDAVPPA